MNLDDLNTLNTLDAQNFLADVDGLPDQVAQAWALAQGYSVPDDYRNVTSIVITGMGGSAIGGSPLPAHLGPGGPLPLRRPPDYDLPPPLWPRPPGIRATHP